MLRPVSLDSHEAQEIQFACRRTCWDEKNFGYQITDIQLVENDALQSEFLQKQHELSIEGRSPKELIEEFAFLDVTDKTKRSAVCTSGLTSALSDTSNSALGDPSQGVTVWRCPDLCIQKETEGGPKNHVVAMFKIMRGRPRTVVPQSNLGLPPKPAQHFDSHVPCVVFSGADDMTSAMQIYLYELNKVDHKPLTRPRHCCPYAIIFYKNKASQDVTSTKPAKVAKISRPVTSVTKQQQPASGRRLIPFGEKMVTYSIAWSGTLTNKDKELGRVDFLAGQGCKVPSLGTKVVRVSAKMGLPSLKEVLPPECLKNVGSAWDKRLRHESWRYNVLVVRPIQESRDTMARFCAFLRQSNSATVSTLLVAGAPAPVKLFLMPSCKFTEDLGLGTSSDQGKMFAILSYKVLPPSSTHSKLKNKKNSKEKVGMPLTEKQPCTHDYMDNDFVQDDYDVDDQVPSLVDSFNTNVFTTVFNLEKSAPKQMDPKSGDKQGKGSAIAEVPQAGSKVKDPPMQQPFRDISSGVVPNTEGRGRQRNGVLEQSNFADDASVGSRRSAETTSQVLNPVDNAIPVDPRLARRRQPSSESNTSSIENRTPPMETPQSPDSISLTIPERDFVETDQSTASHISSGKHLDITSQSVHKDKTVEQPEIPLVRKPPSAVTTKNDEESALTQTLDETVKSVNEVKKTSATSPTQTFLPKKRPVRGVFAHLKNKGPSHTETTNLDTDLEMVDLATTQRPRRSGIPFGSALKITVKNQNVFKEKSKECSAETKVIKKMKTDDSHSHVVVGAQMAETSPMKQPMRDNYDNVMMELDSDTAEPEGEKQEEKDGKDKCKETQLQNGTAEKDTSKTDSPKHSKEENGDYDNTKKAAVDAGGREKRDAEEAGTLIVPTHHRYNQGDSFYRANLIRNPWLDDNDELMKYRHVVPKGATNISPPRKGVPKEQKDNSNQQEQIQDQGQHQQEVGNSGVESKVNHSHGHSSLSSRHKTATGTSESHSKEACSSSKVLKPDCVKATPKVEAEDVTRVDVQENTKSQPVPDSQQTAAQEKDARPREQRPLRNSSSSSTFSRSRSKSKSRSVRRTRSRSKSQPRGRNRTKSRSRKNPNTKSRSRSPQRSPRRRRIRSRSRQRDRSRSKSKDSPQGRKSGGKPIPRARRSGISVPTIGRKVLPGFHMNITSPHRRKRPERRKRSSSSSSSDSSERPRQAYDQLDRRRRSRIRRNRTKRTCRSSDQRLSRDEDSSSCSPERRSKRRRGSRSNRSSESNDQQEVSKSDGSHGGQGGEKKHDTEGQGKARKGANPVNPEMKRAEKDGRDSNQHGEEKPPMSEETIDLVERVLFLTTGRMAKFDYADRMHKHLFRLGVKSLYQEAKRLATNKGLGEEWLKEEFACWREHQEEGVQNLANEHISTMTRGAIVHEILELRKELNLKVGKTPKFMFTHMSRKDLVTSMEKLRTRKQEILATSAWNVTKASLKMKGEAKVLTTDAGCDENPVKTVPQRKTDGFVKVAKDYTHNKCMGLPLNTDEEEMTQEQLIRARCDDQHTEAALNVFPTEPRYHLDVHMVKMQKSNESRSEAPKKKIPIVEMMATSLEDCGPGTLQDRAVKLEAVVAKGKSPQTQYAPLSDLPVPQPNQAESLVEPSVDSCEVAMDTEKANTENNTHGSRVMKMLSSLVEYTTDSSDESMYQDVDTPDESDMTPEITSESEENLSQEVPQEVEAKCKQLLKQDVKPKEEAKCEQSLEQIEGSESENTLQQEIGVERESSIEEILKQVETQSKSEDVFNQEVGTESEREENLNQEIETEEAKSEEIFEQKTEPDTEARSRNVLEQGIVAETESKDENIFHPEIKEDVRKSEENLKQVLKEECNSEQNLKQEVETESKSEESSKQLSQTKVESNSEEVLSEAKAKPVVLNREAKDALLEQNKDWVERVLEQATRSPEKALGSKEDKDALLKKNKEWVDRVLEKARKPPESDSRRKDKDRMFERSRDWVKRDVDRADMSASMTRRRSSEQISTGKEGGQASFRQRRGSNEKKEDLNCDHEVHKGYGHSQKHSESQKYSSELEKYNNSTPTWLGVPKVEPRSCDSSSIEDGEIVDTSDTDNEASYDSRSEVPENGKGCTKNKGQVDDFDAGVQDTVKSQSLYNRPLTPADYVKHVIASLISADHEEVEEYLTKVEVARKMASPSQWEELELALTWYEHVHHERPPPNTDGPSKVWEHRRSWNSASKHASRNCSGL